MSANSEVKFETNTSKLGTKKLTPSLDENKKESHELPNLWILYLWVFSRQRANKIKDEFMQMFCAL